MFADDFPSLWNTVAQYGAVGILAYLAWWVTSKGPGLLREAISFHMAEVAALTAAFRDEAKANREFTRTENKDIVTSLRELHDGLATHRTITENGAHQHGPVRQPKPGGHP